MHPDFAAPAAAGKLSESLPFEGASLRPIPDASGGLDENPRYRVLRGFTSRFLPDPRDITVWLPQAYLAEPERRFPVFYLHDGQNLFDGRTSYVVDRTWRAQTAADSMTREGAVEPLILVGVANTGLRRMPEYTPTRDLRLGGGEGPSYGRLLVEELKPLIDRSLRTLTGSADTGLGGSSLGGLISLALGLQYPDVFSKLAVLSPSIWWDGRSILRMVGAASPALRPRIWLDMGTAEGLRHLRDCDLLYRRLLARGWQEKKNLYYERVEGGLHNEDAWADRFPEVLRFLFPAREKSPDAHEEPADAHEEPADTHEEPAE